MFDLKGKVAFVTGSARRVGREIALEFARQGCHVVIHYATASSVDDARSAEEIVRSFGVETLLVSGDQSQAGDSAVMFEQIQARFGRLDVMVNSAAIFKRTPLLEISEAEWDQVLGVNLKGPFLNTQQAARLMVAGGAGGVILNISDNSGLNPWASRPHHSVSKAGVIMLTQVSALALAEHGIRVNCVIPGPVLPPAGEPESVLDEIAAGLPLGRIGSPGNIAAACVFLAVNDFATGSILRVDGGEGLVGGQT